jgi:dTDP-4-amino-4,6-dideoxygalactose transaminase
MKHKLAKMTVSNLGNSMMEINLTDTNLILEELAKEIARYIGTRYAVLCSSGRTAIRLSFMALGIGHGDEVVIPDFASQILPITVFCNGAIPKFCDIDRETLALSPTSFQKVLSPKTKAVIFVSLFGFPVDPFPTLEIARKKGIILVDNAAQSLGASIRGKKFGSFGDFGIITFNKSLNIDLGAAITTDNEELAAKVRQIREKYERRSILASLGYRIMEISRLRSRRIMRTIFQGDRYLHKLLDITLAEKHFQFINGWMKANRNVFELWRANSLKDTITNQLMTYGGAYSHKRKLEKMEISCLKHEFERLEEYLQDRKKIAKLYDESLKEDGLSKITLPPDFSSSYIRYPVLFSNKNRLSRCIKDLIKAGFPIDGRYKPLHTSPFFKWTTNNVSFKETYHVSEHILPLPIKNINANFKKAEKVSQLVNFHSSK